MADDFCKFFRSRWRKMEKKELASAPQDGKRRRSKPNRLSESEIITILILFHSGGFRCLKHFYAQYMRMYLTHLFTTGSVDDRKPAEEQRAAQEHQGEPLRRQGIHRPSSSNSS